MGFYAANVAVACHLAQELLGASKAAEGQVPRSVEVELCRDLVHGAVVGDVVTVMGIVKVMATGDDLGG